MAVLNLNFMASAGAAPAKPNAVNAIIQTKHLEYTLPFIPSPPAFHVTGDAQIIGGCELQHHGIVGCTTASMAAQTIQSQIFIAGINHFFSYRVAGMGLPGVTFTAPLHACLGFEHQHPIAGMG